MLTTYLNSLPYTKFVVIQDKTERKGWDIFKYLLHVHASRTDYKTHCFVLERKPRDSPPNVVYHDLRTDIRNWLKSNTHFEEEVAKLTGQCVVFIDSLAQLLFAYELCEVYRILHGLTKNNSNIQQVVAVLHEDLVMEKEASLNYFRHLSTLYIELESKNCLSYTYKKSQGKVIKKIEGYRMDGALLVTEAVKKPNLTRLQTAVEEVLPENLSTFKIGLSDKDKQSREGLVLPYLPKDAAGCSNINYTFDEVDDWDEEDPDDDLDI